MPDHPPPNPPTNSLRERKKLATRRALSWAAMHLAVTNGLDNLRVEDIAAAAGVSPRTYNNYFTNKEEAICAIITDRAQNITTYLHEQTTTQPLATALTNAMASQYETDTELDRDWIKKTRQIMAHPTIRGEFLKAVTAIETSLATAIAQRLGTPPNDLHANILAATVSAAARVSVDHWLHDPTTNQELADVVRAGITYALTALPTHPTGE